MKILHNLYIKKSAQFTYLMYRGWYGYDIIVIIL